MCLAELFVSTTCPLTHRWYHLITPCTPTAHLSACPSKKLALEGWEIKASFCPWCDGWDDIPASEYLLLGSASNICSPITGSGPLSRVPSSMQSVSEARRDSRRSSLSRTSSTTSVGTVAGAGPVASAATRNVAINERFDEYLNGGGQRIMERSRTGSSEDGGANGETGSVKDVSGEGLVSRGWSKARKKSKDLSVFWK